MLRRPTEGRPDGPRTDAVANAMPGSRPLRPRPYRPRLCTAGCRPIRAEHNARLSVQMESGHLCYRRSRVIGPSSERARAAREAPPEALRRSAGNTDWARPGRFRTGRRVRSRRRSTAAAPVVPESDRSESRWVRMAPQNRLNSRAGCLGGSWPSVAPRAARGIESRAHARNVSERSCTRCRRSAGRRFPCESPSDRQWCSAASAY